MGFPFYIAKRYFISKKTHNIITIISWISVVGLAIGTTALIVVLSVFNGFQGLVTSLFSAFNPEIQITVAEGKTFHSLQFPADRIKKLPGVAYYIEAVEENALLKYGNKQYIATIKGVSEGYEKMNRFDTAVVKGKFMLEDKGINMAVLGYGVAYNLGINLNDFAKPVSVYIPRRESTSLVDPTKAFNNEIFYPSGLFSIQQEIDSKYVLVPLSFARTMLNYKDEVTSIEIGLRKDADKESIKEEIQKIAGNGFKVKDRFQQEALLFKIMKSEKWAVFLILSFILLIATFNVIGSVTMLILDKKSDIAVMGSMGADSMMIKKIFLYEGLMINLIGALSGLIIGFIICFLQMKYGIVSLQASGSFLIKAYPVKLEILDFVYVFLTVFVIAYIAAYFPAKRISRKYLYNKL